MKIQKFGQMARIGLLTLLACVALTALCGWTSSCGTAIHKASVSADSIAASLHTAADLNHSLQATGQISIEERQQVATLIDQATQANDVLVLQLKEAQAQGGQVTNASVMSAFSNFLTRLDALEKNGVLHLKSASAQAQFTTILAAVKTEVQILQSLIANSSGSNRSPQRDGYLAFAALALTPEELEALIALALTTLGEGAALVQKLIAMKGESDPKLLEDALSEDAAARTQAQADESAT